MGRYEDNTLRKEDLEMATQMPHIASVDGHAAAAAPARVDHSHGLDDDLILMDVQTEAKPAVVQLRPAAVPVVHGFVLLVLGVKVAMERILYYVLNRRRSLAPLFLLAILVVYSVFSPHLPQDVREYMSRIVAGR